ncbi:MAG TPA: glycosyltransferase [Solirubrobacteraceae bacterium]|jgi:glycosyltransferase involved in cell wall biosynthesis
MSVRLLTLATSSTLPQARVLADSLQRHQPDWPLEVLFVGREREADAGAGQLPLRSVADELDVDVESLIARYDEEDLIALLLPLVLRSYSARGAGALFHLPPTAWVLDDLAPVEAALEARSVLLVPRMSANVPDDGLQPTYAQMERHGRIDETIMGVDGTAGAEGFLVWWAAQVEQTLGSLDGRRAGARPEDRGWLRRMLELAPARFATGVLEDPGCNLSMWNLHLHILQASTERTLVDGVWPLRWLNLPDFRPDRPHQLSAGASRVRISRSPALRELCRVYAQELEQAGWSALDRRQDIGRRLADGLVYDDALNALRSRAEALGERYDLFDPDGEDARAFVSWLEGPAPGGAAYGVNRYVYYRVARERPDVLRAYPDLDGLDGPDYVEWCWVFGREEVSIPDRFLPPRAGSALAPQFGATGEETDQSPEQGASALSGRDTSSLSRQSASAPSGDVASLSESETATLEQPAAIGEPEHPSPIPQNGSAPAVRVTGYLSHTLGLGAAGRGYAQALQAAGVAVSTASVPLHHLELPVELQAGYGRHGFEDVTHDGLHHGFEIVAVNADELPSFVARLGEDYFHGPRIGIWGWETDTIPARWQRAFALVQEVWVYSRFMAQNIGVAAPVPTIALPPPVQPPAESAPPMRLDVPDDGFLFLFVFDYLSTIQRKNPVGLIEAFKRAFAPGEGPRLLLKTINGPLRPLAEEEVLWAAHGRPDIHVIDRSLSGDELNGLMAACDAYVSLHRSEGFGLTMAEAMAIGKPVIGTGYSGNLDFMNVANSYLVEYELGRVGPDCEIYPPEGTWAMPSVEHAAQLMRRVVERPEEAAAIGARAREDVLRELSPRATGAAMRGRLEELAGD